MPSKAELAYAAQGINQKADQALETAKETEKITEQLTSRGLLTEVELVKTNLEALQKLLKEK
ncbi:hypothetical protein D3C87_2118190 [compost metagenome]